MSRVCGCNTNIQCYVSQLASQCIYETIMQMSFCRTHQTSDQAVLEIHMALCIIIGLVNDSMVGVSASIERSSIPVAMSSWSSASCLLCLCPGNERCNLTK